MIISHKLKMIFLKPQKVAGTSFEIALSKFCADGDVITPISDEDEVLRKANGYCEAQNYKDTVWPAEAIADGAPPEQPGNFYNHITAAEAKPMIPAHVWDTYLKVTIVRHPFDRAISRYYWKGAHERGSFLKFVQANRPLINDNRQVIQIDGESVVDFTIKYEEFEAGCRQLEEKLGIEGLWEAFAGTQTKTGTRPKRATVAELAVTEAAAKALIEQISGKDMHEFYGGPPPMNAAERAKARAKARWLERTKATRQARAARAASKAPAATQESAS